MTMIKSLKPTIVDFADLKTFYNTKNVRDCLST